MNEILTRLESARKELLDLGLRNSLLNFRTRAKKIDVIEEISAEVLRILVSESKAMAFLPLPETQESETDNDQLALLNLPQGSSIVSLFGEDEEVDENSLAARHRDTKLQSRLDSTRLHARLLQLSNEARTYVEEQGVNVLYLALGFLHWYESESSEVDRRAPLVLVPVELKRSSARERFKLIYSGEEIDDNLSLLEKLRLEFGITLPSLGVTEDFDLDGYMSGVETAISGQPRWKVQRDEIVLGFFSFGKLLMYRDLDPVGWEKQTDLAGSAIIRALLEDGFSEPSSGIPEEGFLDDVVDITTLNQVVDADSTQTAAVLDSLKGRNLVIQGPPGTGKSQTITNIIAEAVGAGKTILFVSEKMAALEVVKRRLDAVGLGDAALELHSHKTNKRVVLQELSRTLQLGRPVQRKDEAELSALASLRDRLNDYSKAINEPILNSRIAPITAIGCYERLGDRVKGGTRLDFSEMRDWSASEWHKHRLRVQEIDRCIGECGTPDQHPFWGAKLSALLPSDVHGLKLSISDVAKSTAVLIQMAEDLAKSMELRGPRGFAEIEKLSRAAIRASEAPHLQGVALSSGDWQLRRDDIRKLINAGKSLSNLLVQYGDALLPQAWGAEVLAERQTLRSHGKAWYRWMMPSFWKARNCIRALHKADTPKSIDELLNVTEAILEWQKRRMEFDETEGLGSSLFGVQWEGVDSDWDVLEQILEWTIELYNEVGSGRLPKGIIDFLEGGPGATNLNPEVKVLRGKADYHKSQLQSVLDLLEFNQSEIIAPPSKSGSDVGFDHFETLMQSLDRWANGLPQLQSLVNFNAIETVCKEEGLEFVSTAARSWAIDGPNLTEVFDATWYEGLLREAFKSRSPLKRFDQAGHELAIDQFRKLDMKNLEVRRQLLATSHWKRLPVQNNHGEMRVVKQEISKKRRFMPIRKLLANSGRAIQAIKPIFMMSPMSIAKYLEPNILDFDMVIFDEASQVRPVEALGALARGRQAVVVGDNKQLPPTSFFDSLVERDEVEEGDVPIGDLESILNLFVAQGAPQRMLQWHYRSRHHSLIAVSNAQFYDSRLTVFPASGYSTHPCGLHFNYMPETNYERGRSRTNPEEARHVAQAVMRHAQTHPDLSLGVVTFSSAQRDEVLFQVEYLRREDPNSEEYFTGHPEEPFFVKNLENVQGDERDVMYISVGYGKNESGYLAHNFGPVNQDGGERRLNVLITRARYRCEIFANFEAEDIDLARTSASGVAALKKYLAYAKTGIQEIGEVTGGDSESPFEEEVETTLLQLGWSLERQIGVGGFRIDLAVKDSEKPGRYLLGIECDGATYHSARWARDRDRLRQQVLEGLGWRIHRIWSTDWYRNREKEVRRVAKSLEKARAYFSGLSQEPAEPRRQNTSQNSTEIMRESNSNQQPTLSTNVPYKRVDYTLTLGNFGLHEISIKSAAEACKAVVDVEGPIHVDLLLRRITEGAGVKRVGSRIRERLLAGVRHAVRTKSICMEEDFLSIHGRKLKSPRDRTEQEANLRVLDLVPTEEIRLAMLDVVNTAFSISEEEAFKEVLSRLGLQRLTSQGRARLSSILDTLLSKGKIERVNGYLQTR